MKFSNIFFKDLNIYDLLINSIFSIAIAILIFNFTAGFFTIGQLKDFYTGEAVFENYNKQLDVTFFFLYLLIYLIFIPLYKMLKKYIFDFSNSKNHLCRNLSIVFIFILSIIAFGEFFYNHQVFVDPHHQAEHLNTFFMHKKFNMEYYKDIMLVHGGRDIVSGWIGANILGADNLYNYYCANAIFYNLLICIYFLLCVSVFSDGLFFLIPLTGLCIHDNLFILLGCYVLAFLFLIKDFLFKKPILFLGLYIVLSFCFGAFWTTMGMAWVISALPAAVYAFYEILKQKNVCKNIILMALLLLICIAVCYPTLPYFVAQAFIYAKANLFSFGTIMPQINSNYIEFFIKLFAFIAFPVLAILGIKQFMNRESLDKKTMFIIIFSLIFVLCSLTYTLGRIDGDSFVRLSYVSFVFLFILVPSLLYINYKKISSVFINYLILISALGLIAGVMFKFCFTLKSGFFINTRPQTVSSQLKNTGNLDIRNDEKYALEDITSFINKYKKPADTFLDMTNKGLLYYILDTKMPMPYVSYYNMVASSQAQDVVKNWENNEPDVIFINDSSERIDNVYPSLRINAIYRAILLSGNYKLAKDHNDNALLYKAKHEFSDEEKALLDRYLASSQLKYLPDTWGNSVKTLPLIGIEIPFVFQMMALDDSTIFNIHFVQPINGKDLELIYLNFYTNKPAKYIMQVNDSNSTLFFESKNNKVLIPFDNYPSWLLNKKVTDISFKTDLKFNKKPQIEFYKRKS